MTDSIDIFWGWTGIILAALCYGSNYVVAKKFPIGDGFAFQWFMSLGILLTGYVCAAIAGNPPLMDFWGWLGGALWAIGNLLVPTIIHFIGIGMGLLVWSVFNLIIGWSLGEFGLFGIDKQTVNTPWLNILGVCLAVVSMGFYFFVKPTLSQESSPDSDTSTKHSERSHVINQSNSSQVITEENVPILQANGEESLMTFINEETLEEERRIRKLQQDEEEKQSLYESEKYQKQESLSTTPMNTFEQYKELVLKYVSVETIKRITGVLMAMIAGTLYGINMVPYQRWLQNEKQKNINPNPLLFCLSQFSGVFILATTAMIIYIIIKRNLPKIYPQTILPAMISGAMWAVATAGWLAANDYLSIVIAYPIVVVGPMIVGSAWAVFVFREIQGLKNLILLSIALSINIASVICVALSNI